MQIIQIATIAILTKYNYLNYNYFDLLGFKTKLFTKI